MDIRLWTEMHEKLQQSMKKEIETMREVLANMHQEEQSLLINDKSSWSRVMEERSALILRLSDLREERLHTTEKLQLMAFPQGVPEDVPLEDLFPPQDLLSCETLTLRDQLMALVERLNLQSGRNEILFNLSQHPMREEPQVQPHKPKISIATLPPKE